MTSREEIRHRVLEAIERGEIPKGGSSELAAYDLLGDVPAGYWSRWSDGSRERIRELTSRTARRAVRRGESMNSVYRADRGHPEWREASR